MTELSSRFDVKDLSEPQQLLGMTIERPADDVILLNQSAYIDEILHRFAMGHKRPTSKPMIPNTRLDISDGGPDSEESALMAMMPYRQDVGALMYLARVTRPDIVFAVSQVARHSSRPRKVAWNAVKFMFRHIGATKRLRLKLQASAAEVAVATDADWPNDQVDRKSVSDSIVYLFGCPVAWTSKQSLVTTSSTAAEYVAVNDGVEIGLLVRGMVSEVLDKPVPILLSIDSLPATQRLRRECRSGSSKHVDAKFNVIKDLLQAGEIAVTYTPTTEMKCQPIFLQRHSRRRHTSARVVFVA